jgi:hypothetical protein
MFVGLANRLTAAYATTGKHGGFPTDLPKTPEHLAATIYDALGLPATAAWVDGQDRPHLIYHGEPISELF